VGSSSATSTRLGVGVKVNGAGVGVAVVNTIGVALVGGRRKSSPTVIMTKAKAATITADKPSQR
jgi:hypothetical protein